MPHPFFLIRRPFGATDGRFWLHLGSLEGSFGGHFGVILGAFLVLALFSLFEGSREKPCGTLWIFDDLRADRRGTFLITFSRNVPPGRPKGPRDPKKPTFFTPACGHGGYAYSLRKASIHPPGNAFLRVSKPY